jgi:uncharacterized integral membrane protein
MLNRIWNRYYTNIIAFIIALVVVISAIALTNIAISSVVVLQSLIQAEATILGFLGIIIVYMLASYDARLDRLEQQRFDTINMHKEESILGEPFFAHIDRKITSLKQTKKDITQSLGTYSFLLVLSLLLSIATLGMINSNSVFLNFLSGLGLAFFLSGIVGIVIGFIQISREP